MDNQPTNNFPINNYGNPVNISPDKVVKEKPKGIPLPLYFAGGLLIGVVIISLVVVLITKVFIKTPVDNQEYAGLSTNSTNTNPVMQESGSQPQKIAVNATPTVAKVQNFSGFLNQKPQISSVDIPTGNYGKTNDYNLFTAYGHYLMVLGVNDINSPQTLVYDGQTVITGYLGIFELNQNGLHYAFTIMENPQTVGTRPEADDLYVDGKLILSKQYDIETVGIANNGSYLYREDQTPVKPLTNGLTPYNFYNSGTLIQAVNQPPTGDNGIVITQIADNGQMYSYTVNGVNYINGKQYVPSISYPLSFSDNFEHYIYFDKNQTAPNDMFNSKLYVDGKYIGNTFIHSATETGLALDLYYPQPLVSNTGGYAYVDSDGNGGGTVYLQSKPYMIPAGNAFAIFYNPSQNHLLIGYHAKETTNTYFFSSLNWQLDGQKITLPLTSEVANIELDDNNLYIYNILNTTTNSYMDLNVTNGLVN